MIHIQHTSIACGTMVTPFGLEGIAHLAVFSLDNIAITLVVAPVGWHFARVGASRHNEGPYHH